MKKLYYDRILIKFGELNPTFAGEHIQNVMNQFLILLTSI